MMRDFIFGMIILAIVCLIMVAIDHIKSQKGKIRSGINFEMLGFWGFVLGFGILIWGLIGYCIYKMYIR